MLRAIDARPEIDADSTEGKVLTREQVVGDIAFENVHFRYPTRPSVRVLRGLDLKIAAGTSVALCGPSGVCVQELSQRGLISKLTRYYRCHSAANLLRSVSLRGFTIP